MTQSVPEATVDKEDLQHLKQVSRIKHKILEGYLPVWAAILGSRHRLLTYVDCFAGPGKYESGGEEVLGSPAIAVSTGKDFLSKRPNHHLEVVLADEDPKQLDRLAKHLAELRPFPKGLNIRAILADSKCAIPKLLGELTTVPSFFLIDPYGHPLPVPIINRILRGARTEVLINLMWWRINMDMANPTVQKNVDVLFGDDEWRVQPFMNQRSEARRRGFIDYFLSRLDAKYTVPFTIFYDAVEDKVRGERVKYHLIHASNNIKAALLMKEVMYTLGDEDGTFSYSGTPQDTLISETPSDEDLSCALLSDLAGRTLTFDGVREHTYRLPFVEKQYRGVLQGLRKTGRVRVEPVSSKTERGLTKDDLIIFPG
jgi:three-Cys-motif partner protein